MTFLREPGVGFHLAQIGGGGNGGDEEEESGSGGRHPVGGNFCPAPFKVLHNDRIGPLPVPRGDYSIVLLQGQGLNCAQAELQLVRFLNAPGGHLPPPWILEPQTASFRRSASGPGFRIKPLQ